MSLSRYILFLKCQDVVVSPSPPWSQCFNSSDFILVKDGVRRTFSPSKWHSIRWVFRYWVFPVDSTDIGDAALREFISFLLYFFFSLSLSFFFFFLLHIFFFSPSLVKSHFPKISVLPVLFFVFTRDSRVESEQVSLRRVEPSVRGGGWGLKKTCSIPGSSHCQPHVRVMGAPRVSVVRSSDF